MLRSILDFDSYTTVASALTADENRTPTPEEFLGMSPAHKKNKVPTKWERQEKTDAKLEKAERRMDAIKEERSIATDIAESTGEVGKVQLLTKVAHKTFVNSKRKHNEPRVSLEENYQWNGIDYA